MAAFFGAEKEMARRAAHLGWLLAMHSLMMPAWAQSPQPQSLAPLASLPPLLHVKLIGPRGMQVTFFRGSAQGQTFDVPCTIGLRPGYGIRMAITGVPDYPNAAFYPTLDVHGSLL